MAAPCVTLIEAGQKMTSRTGGWFPRNNATREKVVTVISDTML